MSSPIRSVCKRCGVDLRISDALLSFPFLCSYLEYYTHLSVSSCAPHNAATVVFLEALEQGPPSPTPSPHALIKHLILQMCQGQVTTSWCMLFSFTSCALVILPYLENSHLSLQASTKPASVKSPLLHPRSIL